MGMSDGMEDGLMDDEIRSALEMTKDELLARAAKGEPAHVARSDPRGSDFAALLESGVITMESDVSSIVIEQGYFGDHRVVKVERPSVTVRR
jgi:hypothetical protein